jgi:cysteine desulfurase
MEAYFDNSATTRVMPEVKDLVVKLMEEDYGNPSSLHIKGVDAGRYIREAKENIARELKVEPKEITFTSGGTESNNLAIIGVAMANRRAGNRIITTAIEHASVSNTMKYLEEMGFEVVYLNVDKHGIVDLEQFDQMLNDDTILVSVMYVNNEIGSVQPIEKMADIIKKHGSKALLHVDAIQAFGKMRIYPKRMGIDLMSISGHKIHGPKGTGAVFVKDKTKIKPVIYGGGQQQGLRSGTENVPGYAGLGLATKLVYANLEENVAHMTELKDRLISQLTEIEDVYSNSGEAPHIASITFKGVRSEVMLHALEERGIYVSAGSACSSNKPAVSSTLKAIGLAPDRLESTLRFSFSYENTIEEVDYAVAAVQELLPVLRRYVRKK